MKYKYKTCTKCHQKFNVSVKDTQEHYVCQECEPKAKKHDGIVTKVLLKNKNKVMRGC